jgi:hypothetical protein
MKMTAPYSLSSGGGAPGARLGLTALPEMHAMGFSLAARS